MPEITDAIIKQKRNEFIKDIQAILDEVQMKPKQTDLMSRLRETARKMTARKPMTSFPKAVE